MYGQQKLMNGILLLQVVANYFGNKKKYEPVKGKKIHWAGNRKSPPKDVPLCGFDGSGCPPQGKKATFL